MSGPAPWPAPVGQTYREVRTCQPYYQGIAQAHGSRIQGDFDDTTLGMPTYKNIWVSH
jgi:hypothetical protein